MDLEHVAAAVAHLKTLVAPPPPPADDGESSE